MDEVRSILRYLVVLVIVVAILAEVGWIAGVLWVALEPGVEPLTRGLALVVGVVVALLVLAVIGGLAIAASRLSGPEANTDRDARGREA